MGEEGLPGAVVELFASILVWLFGVTVFLPMARRVDPEGLPVLISLTVFIGFSVLFIRGLVGVIREIDTVSRWAADRWGVWRSLEPNERLYHRSGRVVRILVLVVIYLLYLPLLNSMHPALNGVGLIILLLSSLYVSLGR